MDYYKKYIASRIVVAILSLFAITVIATAVYKKVAINNISEDTIIIDIESTPLNGRVLRHQLGFDSNQMDQYRDITREFRHKANEIIHSINNAKIELFNELKSEDSRRKEIEKWSNIIGEGHKRLKIESSEYYLKLKEICTPEQKIELSKIFTPLFKQDRGQRDNAGRRGRQH
jgi:Spy/CpxP family protein refolding chaperone